MAQDGQPVGDVPDDANESGLPRLLLLITLLLFFERPCVWRASAPALGRGVQMRHITRLASSTLSNMAVASSCCTCRIQWSDYLASPW